MRAAFVVVTSLFSLVASAATPAHAQSLRPQPIIGPIVGPPAVTWLGITGAGDSSSSDRSDRSASSALEPIRLGLMSDAPAGGATEGPCERNEPRSFEAATSPTTPFQSALGVRLVPRLTLFAFSRGGCAFDAAAGGALVFVQPLAPKVSLVLSAGAIYLPHYGTGGNHEVVTQARADVVFQRSQGRTLTVGIATPRTGGGSPRLTFGGLW